MTVRIVIEIKRGSFSGDGGRGRGYRGKWAVFYQPTSSYFLDFFFVSFCLAWNNPCQYCKKLYKKLIKMCFSSPWPTVMSVGRRFNKRRRRRRRRDKDIKMTCFFGIMETSIPRFLHNCKSDFSPSTTVQANSSSIFSLCVFCTTVASSIFHRVPSFQTDYTIPTAPMLNIWRFAVERVMPRLRTAQCVVPSYILDEGRCCRHGYMVQIEVKAMV